MTCPIPKLMFHGSFEKEFALTSMALLRSRSPENVVFPRTVSGSGTSYSTLASRRTWAPSSSADTTGSSPHASSVGVSPGRPVLIPVFGSNDSWSTIDRRTKARCSSSVIVPPPQSNGPTTESERAVPLKALLMSTRSTLADWPGAMSPIFTAETPSTTAGAISVRLEPL